MITNHFLTLIECKIQLRVHGVHHSQIINTFEETLTNKSYSLSFYEYQLETLTGFLNNESGVEFMHMLNEPYSFHLLGDPAVKGIS